MAADQRLKRSLANKRFYDFGSRSVRFDNDDDFQEFNDQYNEQRRFYDFGTKKRFYDFGSKKKRSNNWSHNPWRAKQDLLFFFFSLILVRLCICQTWSPLLSQRVREDIFKNKIFSPNEFFQDWLKECEQPFDSWHHWVQQIKRNQANINDHLLDEIFTRFDKYWSLYH